MSYLAVLLVLASAFLHALKSLFIKKAHDKDFFILWYSWIGLLLYLPLFGYFVVRAGAPLSPLFFWSLASGFIHFCYVLCVARSYEAGDLSLVYPIMRSSPALVLVCAVVFVGEEVSVRGVSGILLVVFGVYIINLKRFNLRELLLPLKALFQNRPTQFALLTMLTVAGYSIVDKLAVLELHPFIFLYTYALITVLFYSAYLWMLKDHSGFMREWRLSHKSILINGLISKGGYLLILIAFTFENVSYVAGFRQLSIVFAVLLGGHLLNEESRIIRLAAAIIICSGAALIAMA